MMKIYKHHELARPSRNTSYCTQSREVHCEPFEIGERAVGQRTFMSGALPQLFVSLCS